MRKCVVVQTLFLWGLISMATVVFASVPRNELALGGVTLFTSLNNVQNIYGTPAKSFYNDEYLGGGKVRVYKQLYGNGSFSVIATNYDGVVSVRTTENNGIATPAGIKVGMNATSLLAVYGAADYKYADGNGNSVFVYSEKKTGVGVRDELRFTINSGKIAKIELIAGILSL